MAADLEVTYRLEEDDYRALAKFLMYRTPRGQRILRRHTVTAIVLSVGAASVIYALRSDAVLAVLFGVFCYVVMQILRRTNEKTLLHKIYTAIRPPDDRRLGVPGTLKLTPEGLEAQSGRGAGKVDWRGVSQIGRDAAHIFIVLGRANAFVVPLREFDGPERFEAFYQRAVEHHAAAFGMKGRG